VGSGGLGGGGRGGAGASGRGGAGGAGAGGSAGTGGARDAGLDAVADAGADRFVADGPPGDAAVCVALAQLALGPRTWSEQVEGSTAWIERPPVAGGRSRLAIPFMNLSSAQGPSYPGIDLTTITAGVRGAGVTELFGIGPNQTVVMDWYIQFGSPIASGDTVHFRAEVFADDVRRTRCADSPAVEFDVVLQ
jgi:hypothetical protein